MADVSHELGALRFVVESPLSSKVAMFNNAATRHQESQHLNPFSQTGGLPKPTFNKGEYGKPLAGSLTEMRGQKANIHVLKEMLELCQIIDSEGYSVKDEPSMKVIPFGELFNIYTYISDKVVGILLRARKHKLIEFEGEVLFQRRDDDVPIFLLKPIKEIRQILEEKQEEIRRSVSPAPQATTVMMDQQRRGPSPSPTPVKPKAIKNTEKQVEDSKTVIVKPIAVKAIPVPTIEVQADQTKSEVQNQIKAELLPKETVKEPKEAAASQEPAQIPVVTAQESAISPQTAETPSIKVALEPEVAPAESIVNPAEPALAPTEPPVASPEQTPITPNTDEVISPTKTPPETTVTPPTPTAESSNTAALTPTVDESNPAIIEEKTDINNNEEAPAIIVAVEPSSNAEGEAPAEVLVAAVPNIV